MVYDTKEYHRPLVLDYADMGMAVIYTVLTYCHRFGYSPSIVRVLLSAILLFFNKPYNVLSINKVRLFLFGGYLFWGGDIYFWGLNMMPRDVCHVHFSGTCIYLYMTLRYNYVCYVNCQFNHQHSMSSDLKYTSLLQCTDSTDLSSITQFNSP